VSQRVQHASTRGRVAVGGQVIAPLDNVEGLDRLDLPADLAARPEDQELLGLTREVLLGDHQQLDGVDVDEFTALAVDNHIGALSRPAIEPEKFGRASADQHSSHDICAD
jgi:hypothetical protein